MTSPAPLPAHPGIYEINTWPWLAELSEAAGQPVSLATVPGRCWDEIAALGVDAVWLMGVWERSPAGAAVARARQALLDFGRSAIPGFTPADVVGSAYCVRRYGVDDQLGGWAGLDAARDELRRRGLGLILDYVPNHVAPDHPWIADHLDYFLAGTEDDLAGRPGEFVRTGTGAIVALARDPYFPPWPDVIQLNAFHAGVRDAAVGTLTTIGEHCDGVRCDMAMLLRNDVFARTWGERPGPVPADDYWTTVIPGVKRTHPDMTFLAEAYWDLEWALMQQGFDYCYDKRLYDRLVARQPEPVRLHLLAGDDYQRRLVRFLENHDEPRMATALPGGALRAAVVAVSTLPGAVLYHDGQMTGRRLRLPVELGRRPPEAPDDALLAFHRAVLPAGRAARRGTWQRCQVDGWPDNQSGRNLVAWCWRDGDAMHLVVVNLSSAPVEALVRVPSEAMPAEELALTDAVTGAVFDRRRSDIAANGLYVGLAPDGFHLLHHGGGR